MKRLILKIGNKTMPPIERRKEIQEIVNDLANKNQISMPSFDIIKFLKNKGFAIASKPMIDDTTGMLLVDDNDVIPDTDTHKLIVTNALLQEEKEFLQRRRFIIAHEYGHYILHKKDSLQYAHRDTSQKDTVEEKEADYFARCLLMPKDMLEIFLQIDFVKNASLEEKVSLVSRLFNVTKKKATQRLKEDLCYAE